MDQTQWAPGLRPRVPQMAMNMSPQLSSLYNPISIREMRLRNRIVMPAMRTGLATETGHTTERLIAYYAARARGGVGLIIIENTCVDLSTGRSGRYQLSVEDDRYLAGLGRLVDRVHAHGARIALQLNHAGRKAAVVGMLPISSSAVPVPGRSGPSPRPMDHAEIGQMVHAFAEGTRRARGAGFDAVEVHAAHGYLLAQFLSPYVNCREDEYGGHFERRCRFPLEVVEAVREQAAGMAVIVRISIDEQVDGGIRATDGIRIAQHMVDRGADAIHVTAGVSETEEWQIAPMAMPAELLVPFASQVKAAVSAPVIAVGRIHNPVGADELIAQGKTDLVAMGRALIADPDLPNKALRGAEDRVIPCIACNQGCIGQLATGQPISCTLNPHVGREGECEWQETGTSRSVLVLGGGPAGMVSATIASLRGHSVVVYEKEPVLGGQLRYAELPPHKGEMKRAIEYLCAELARSGAEVRLGQRATEAVIQELNPDAIILATGIRSQRPPIPGADLPHVFEPFEVLSGNVSLGKTVAVLGGGLVGCETSDELSGRGHHVVLVEMEDQLAAKLEGISKRLLLARLVEQQVTIHTSTTVESISASGVNCRTLGGNRISIPVDSVVLAMGAVPEQSLWEAAQDLGVMVHLVGDCREPRMLFDAVAEGYDAACQI